MPRLRAFLLSFLLFFAPGCPNWQRPTCTTPGAYACADDQPQYCSTSGELTPIGDEPCAAQGRTCALTDRGLAYCAAAPTNGGAR